jgi:hypothetical protein
MPQQRTVLDNLITVLDNLIRLADRAEIEVETLIERHDNKGGK